MEYKRLVANVRQQVLDLFAYVKRESGTTGMYLGQEVWWGASLDNDFTVDVSIDVLDGEGRPVRQRDLGPEWLAAIERGYKRLMVWRDGGSFPETAEELFAVREG
jgi:hypothetical protein